MNALTVFNFQLTSVSAEVSPVPPSQRVIGSNEINEEKVKLNLRWNTDNSRSRNSKRTYERAVAEENENVNGHSANKHSKVDHSGDVGH